MKASGFSRHKTAASASITERADIPLGRRTIRCPIFVRVRSLFPASAGPICPILATRAFRQGGGFEAIGEAAWPCNKGRVQRQKKPPFSAAHQPPDPIGIPVTRSESLERRCNPHHYDVNTTASTGPWN